MPGDAPLQQLRDIHLPEPVPIWPPAPGWYALMLVTLAVVALAWWVYRRRRQPIRRTALQELARHVTQFEQGNDAQQLASGVSTLLRRCALSRFSRAEVAGLCGEDWMAFLDRTGGHGQFTTGPGRCLLTAPYRPADPVDADALVRAARQWIDANGGARPSTGVAKNA